MRTSLRWVRRVALTLLAVLVLDVTAVTSRAPRLDVVLPAAGSDTWVIAGIDDRAILPAGPDDLGGHNRPWRPTADIIIVVTKDASGTRAFSVPRDLVLRDSAQRPFLLGASWAEGRQEFVDALCSAGIPAGHLVAVNLRGFVTMVDSLGGIDVQVPFALRDAKAHLDIGAGSQHVDGRTALALVRSRQGQVFQAGRWIADPERAAGRQRRAGEVLRAVLVAAKAHPWRWQTLAWRVLPDVSVDPATQPVDLARLAGLSGEVAELPAKATAGVEIVTANRATVLFLRDRGLGRCPG